MLLYTPNETGAAECHCSLDRGYSNGSWLQAHRDRLSLRLSNSDSIHPPGTHTHILHTLHSHHWWTFKLITSRPLQDGSSHYLKGILLLLCYIVIGACFFVTRQPASTLAPSTEQTGIYTVFGCSDFCRPVPFSSIISMIGNNNGAGLSLPTGTLSAQAAWLVSLQNLVFRCSSIH